MFLHIPLYYHVAMFGSAHAKLSEPPPMPMLLVKRRGQFTDRHGQYAPESWLSSSNKHPRFPKFPGDSGVVPAGKGGGIDNMPYTCLVHVAA